MENQQIWDYCIARLEAETHIEDFNTYIRPITVIEDQQYLILHAPNRFLCQWLQENTKEAIQLLVSETNHPNKPVVIEIEKHNATVYSSNNEKKEVISTQKPIQQYRSSNALNPAFVFDTHIEGKSNQIARAASKQVSENPGTSYNPLFIYGGVGLGKTHLMHAAGNLIQNKKQGMSVSYVHSERFVNDMVEAIRNNKMKNFKNYYRSLDALLIDDIQFFAGKAQSQEEFFHTFNTLLESGSQIILTSDKFPKEINNLQERLISRFESGLTVRIDPPELETRVAILKNKALKHNINLDDNVAFFVAEKIRSNVRELEGALHRLVASSGFVNREIDLMLAKEILQDLTLFQERKVSIENIQKTTCEFYTIRVSEIKSKRRTRKIARPRQIAMALAKELTTLSLPDIGDAFGGRDHTTVLHACKKVKELVNTDSKIHDDYHQLLKILSV